MTRKICLLITVLFLFSCAQIVRSPVKYDQQSFDTMFDAAIRKGTQLSYTIDQQNREYGFIKMSRRVINSTYLIKVKFGPDTFTVEGGIDTDILNPMIHRDVKIIEEAITRASGQSTDDRLIQNE